MITLLRLLGNLVRLVFLPLWPLRRWLGRPKAPWLRVRLGSLLVDVAPDLPRWMRWLDFARGPMPTSLARLRLLVEHVRADPAIRGVLFDMPTLASGWATAAALRDVLLSLRAGGKEVVVHLPDGGGNREMYVASAATRIVMGPSAGLTLLGVSAERRYYKPLLDKIGLDVEVHARSEFKTAAEGFARSEMSEAHRIQTQALLETFDGALVDALSKRAGLDEARVRALFARGLLHGQAAVEAGLIDAIAYPDQLEDLLEGKALEDVPAPSAKKGKKSRIAPARRYLAWREMRPFAPLRDPPYIAVVPVHGLIRGNEGTDGDGADGTIAALAAARRDRRVVGVVLHVNSPGGSALVSDQIHREVLRLKQDKPVVSYFADVAASGGYYVAAPTEAIVAQATTVTGSIGVISMKLAASGLLSKLGVHTETLRLAPHADMFSVARTSDAEEHALMEAQTQAFYEDFVAVVAKGRRRGVEEVEPLARGRVWSGRDALRHGLVDKLGGFDVALDELRRVALSRDKPLPASAEPRLARKRRGVRLPRIGAVASRLFAKELGGFAPELGFLLSLAREGPGALYYAVDLPRID